MNFNAINNERYDTNDYHRRGNGYFPLQYYVDFLKFLRENDDIVEIITYDDLPWGDDYDSENAYPRECKNWERELKIGIRDTKKIYVLLQHDVDNAPEKTIAILREEERLGIPSNVMIFNCRVNRRHLAKTGEVLYTEYNIDYNYLRRLQGELGFVIGYHSNAYERALFNREKALRIFEDDIIALRQYFNIKYFSPHGGARDVNGLSNNSLTIPESLRNTPRWISNTRTPRFDGIFSDGGINNPKSDPLKRDMRDFVRTWKRGKRYRILTHPQHYTNFCKPSRRMMGTPWYDSLLDFYTKNMHATAWDTITLD